MMHFIKANPDLNDIKLEELRGEVRKNYLEKFMIHMLRQKNATKTISTSKTIETKNSSKGAKHWMSAEIMDLTLGQNKAEHWRASGLLRHRPDKITGSDEPDFREWEVPEDWDEWENTDGDKIKIEGQCDASAEDLTALPAASSDNHGQSSEVDKTIKEEPGKEDPDKTKTDAIRSNPRSYYDTFTSMKVESQTILNLAAKNQSVKTYAAALMADVEKQLPKITRILKILDKMLVAPAVDAEMPKLVSAIDQLQQKHAEVLLWASRFGLEPNGSPAGKKRKRAASAVSQVTG